MGPLGCLLSCRAPAKSRYTSRTEAMLTYIAPTLGTSPSPFTKSPSLQTLRGTAMRPEGLGSTSCCLPTHPRLQTQNWSSSRVNSAVSFSGTCSMGDRHKTRGPPYDWPKLLRPAQANQGF